MAGMRRAWIVLLLLVAPAAGSDETLRTFDACWRLVRRHFYDEDLHGVDWAAVRARYRPQADRARPGAELAGVLAGMLGELKASHAAVLQGEAYRGLIAELHNRRYWTFGLLLEESRPNELFVRAMYEGGPGPAAGLRVGDRVDRIDKRRALSSDHLLPAGYDPAPGAKRLFFLRARAGARLRLGVWRRPDAGASHETVLVAKWTNAVDATRASVRVIRRGPYRIGTLHLWYCQRGVVKVLDEALSGALAKCDALVLDLRGRGGWADIAHRIVDRCEQWRRPVVFLVDRRTRSAKELLAHEVRRRRAGWLVGERTEGAVLGAGFYPLPDGSFLELPIVDVRTSDGVRLEGRGVAPHFEATLVVPFAAGRDGILERGLAQAAREAAARRGWATMRRLRVVSRHADKEFMPDPRSGGEPQRKQDKERLDIEVVRFDSVRLPSGMFTHRTAKVIIPASDKPPSR